MATLTGKKWEVTGQKGGDAPIVIEPTSAAETVYVFNCEGAVIQINGKVTQVSIDKCTKTGVIASDVVAGVEVVNSKGCQVQIQNTCPTVSFDKADGGTLFLTEENRDSVTIISSLSSGLNVSVDCEEHPVPYQFQSTFKNGKMVTESVSHI